ncbi:MAG: response regulator transcription factor [Ruminococcaceae bacterium]|nr:response regulator transcription factor [Oscillospiraceae bacterium]
MLNILIVEDNLDLRELMSINLRGAGYSVLEAGNGEEALSVLDHSKVHLMIVDLMMPVMDGFELTEAVRNADESIPIMIITAKEALEDKRKSFRKGADDYMVKPIEMEEMLMRVKALLRRADIASDRILRVGECVLSEDSLTLTKGSDMIEFRLKEFRLLHTLLSYPGKIFTRHALMDEIWGYDNESDYRTVDVHIKRLREKVEGITDFEIQTVRGLGYKVVINE